MDEYPHLNLNSELLDKRIENKIQARPVFDALNDLGSTPWKINEVRKILNFLRKVHLML